MAGKRIDIMDQKQLLQLKRRGWSNRNVARQLGLSRNTVNSYVRAFTESGKSFEELAGLSDAQLSQLLPNTDEKENDRYEQLASYFRTIEQELTQTGATLKSLWQWYIQKHPDGYSYTQFAHHYRQWHKQVVEASGILNHKAGQQLLVDFAGKTLPYVDRQTGEIHQAQVFVALLPASQYTYVQAVASQKREDVIRCLNNCLWWLGGVPAAIVPDNISSVVTQAHKYAPRVSKTLKAFGLHYGCVIDPTRPRSPKDKALVENAVNLVYQRIFYPLSAQTFFSVAELNRGVQQRLGTYNEAYRFQHIPMTRRQRFVEVEADRLAPLPNEPYRIRYYHRAKVQKNHHILLSAAKNYYSVPYRYIGRRVEVQYNDRVVEVFYNHERIASHRRSHKPGRYTTNPEHRPPNHQAYSDWSPEYFERQAQKVGDCCHRYIRRLMRQYDYPEKGYKQAQGILAMGRHYPRRRLEAACHRGLAHSWSSYRTIEQILKKGLDQLPQTELEFNDASLPEHPNIRGSTYYR